MDDTTSPEPEATQPHTETIEEMCERLGPGKISMGFAALLPEKTLVRYLQAGYEVV